MSILTNGQRFMNTRSHKIYTSYLLRHFFILSLAAFLFIQCQKPDQDIELRRIKDVVMDATTDPLLKANAIFYNPNKAHGRLKKIKVEIFINGKKVGDVDQTLKMKIPSREEFTVPLEVKLAMKELGFMDTVLGMIGGKKFDVHYKGFLKLSYHGLPIKIPVDYKDEIKVKF
jgi:LEA14-like dessication related protein